MPTIIVTNGDKGTFKILINYIQRGCLYTSRLIADNEANKLRKEISLQYVKSKQNNN